MLVGLVCDPSLINPLDRGLGQRYGTPSKLQHRVRSKESLAL
jgi:hypothetical protein